MIAGRGRTGSWLLAGAGLTIAAALLGWYRAPAPPTVDMGDFAALLRAFERETDGAFPRHSGARGELRFPRDHGSHPDRPFEVWETVAQLQGDDGPLWLRFRIVRLAASPAPAVRTSAWAANEFLRCELTVSEPQRAPAVTVVRSSRVALGIAGHTADPPKIWIDGDSLTWPGSGESLTVELFEPEFSGRLQFTMVTPRVSAADADLTGGLWDGYLYPRLAVSGELTTGRGTRVVTGSGWVAHNFGPLPPVGGQLSFDRWFVQFDDGAALAVLQTRRRDGSAAPTQRGIGIGGDGRVEALGAADVRLQTAATRDGRPSAWTLATADGRLRLEVEALSGTADRAVNGPGWSSAIRVHGSRAGQAVTGWGLVELGTF